MRKEISPLCALSLSLTVVLLIAGLAAVIAGALVPNLVLPAMDVPMLAALSLIALALETVVFGHGSRQWVASLAVAVVDFGLLSLCTGRVSASQAVQVAALGGVVFLVLAFLVSPFGIPAIADWLMDRLYSLKYSLQDFITG